MPEIPRQIAKAQINEIIRSTLLGYRRDFVAEKTGLSTGTVSNYWNRFLKDAKRMGLSRVSREHNVVEEIKSLRALGTELQREGINVTNATNGARIINALRRLKVDESNLEEFITSFYNYTKDKEYNPSDLAVAAARMLSLERQHRLDYNSLLHDYQGKLGEVNNLTDNINKLRMEEKEAWRRRDHVFDVYKVTVEELEEYVKVRKELTGYGVEVSETGRLSSMMRNAKAVGFKSERILNFITNAETLSQQGKQLNDGIDQLMRDKDKVERSLSRLTAEVKELERQRESLKGYIDVIKQEGIEGVKKVKEEALRNIEKFIEEESKALDQQIASTNEVCRTVSKMVIDSQDQISRYIDSTLTSIKRITERAGRTGEAVMRLESLKPTLNFIEKGEGDPRQVLRTMHLMCSKFKDWLKNNPNIEMRFGLENSNDSLLRSIETSRVSGRW